MKRLYPVFLLLALAVLGSGKVFANTLSLLPASQNASPGSIVSLDLVADTFSPLGIGAFDIDVTFDPLALAFQDLTFGSGLDLGITFGSIQTGPGLDTGTGLIELAETSLIVFLAGIQSFPLTLATIDFLVIDLPVGVTTDVLIDDGAVGAVPVISDAFGVSAPVDSISNATITGVAASVPEPGSLALLACGLIVVVVKVRRHGRAGALSTS